MVKKPKVIVIVGPTASGKSDLAIRLAKKHKGEIISADSRQVYRGMDIGTGKVSKQEQKKIKHHLIDVMSPKKQYTVDDFTREAEKAIKDILKRSRLPIIVGGTGLYVDTLIYDLKYPNVPPDKKLRSELEKQTPEQLFKKLEKLDPNRAKTIEKKNKRRLIRALEIIRSLGKIPNIDVRPYHKKSKYHVIWLGLNPNNTKRRIKNRLEKRLRQGMVKEVRKLKGSGLSWKRLDSFGLEYRWIAKYLRGKVSYKEMRAGLYIDIIRYSKRQMVWFKRNPHIHWLKNTKQMPPV
ncbi:MAG TPA: tRNA (adenosine(37)-N6)-dimethylallyltransferase MiaA [Candidatus Paceibacterota bacterium]